MPILHIYLSEPADTTASLMALRRLIRLPLSSLREVLMKGAPLPPFRLFYNDHETLAAQLRELIKLAEGGAFSMEIFEFEEGEEGQPGSSSKGERLPFEVLKNMLDSWDERGRKLDEEA